MFSSKAPSSGCGVYEAEVFGHVQSGLVEDVALALLNVEEEVGEIIQPVFGEIGS